MNAVISNIKTQLTPTSRILFPESQDIRIIIAAIQLKIEGVIAPVLFWDKEKCLSIFEDETVRAKWNLEAPTQEEREVLGTIEYIECSNAGKDGLIEAYKRKKGGNNIDVEKFFPKDLSEAARLLKNGTINWVVAGSIADTKDVIRVGYYALGLAEDRRISGEFLMIPGEQSIIQKQFIVGDSAVNPNPTSSELVQIWASLVETHTSFFPDELARVAFLSFSTQRSGIGESVDKVHDAAKLFREKYPEIESDGPIQMDAALIYDIYLQKMKWKWSLTWEPNILIFPDLDSGNIGYKMMERFGGYHAIWPILTGFSHPAWSDLSRGTSIDTIIDMAYVTALRSLRKSCE